ncbi:Putative transmembrane protein (PGPGW) [Desulfocicer vacuolatum DSM 3385]|uniref:Putative transmembrane protein (PGPGW) n=1 Tax=Desulfocicer vacuolatum DSM 3385 TaxID=1121400 RepID=A0A1W2B7I2_9BACT|nr:PGPGW domain-containing protein [Desulfocicer vacuolatum]SMC68927.1 Putative transmembrane protein (PGPGW) [Desulfocicer vacuolatum DSM 3385]
MIFKGVLLSCILCVGTLLFIPWLVCRIPESYFIHRSLRSSNHRTPLAKGIRRVIKNCAGVLLVLAGIVMLFVPGQGLLTILIGVMLIDFPGKRLVEKKMVSIKSIQIMLNWIRKKNNVKELKFP